MIDERDIGHGVAIAFANYKGTRAGIQYTHPDGKGGECSGWAPFLSYSKNGWTVEQEEPLTLSPSLLCRICGHHGFIRNGRWVPA